MSETETSVPMDDKALFESATSDAAPETVTEQPAATEQADGGQKHDPATGRFLPKSEPEQQEATAEAAKPEPSVETKPAPVETRQEPPPGWIPAWRAREIADAKTQKLEAELRKYTEKPQDPIDPYVDPEKFRDAGVRQAIDPVVNQMSQLREHYSWKDALREHKETAIEARKWFYEAVHAGDPNIQPLLQKALSSIDPFDDIVNGFKQHKAVTTVGADPNAWFEKELERRMADPAFAAKFQPAQQSAQGDPKTNVIKIPPSLNRQTGSASAASGTMSDTDLYAHATS
jgi:hypothetical protein